MDNNNAKVWNRNTEKLESVKVSSVHKPKIMSDELDKWQNILDLIIELLDIPTALIMRVSSNKIEVFTKSNNPENPYSINETADLGAGLYCETVMAEEQALEVTNALTNDLWKDNPDVKLNMIYYYGLPLAWPDGEIFGTICVLDDNENHLNQKQQKLMREFKLAIESHLNLLSINEDLQFAYDDLKEHQDLLLKSERNAAYGYIITGLSAQMASPISVLSMASSYLKLKLAETNALTKIPHSDLNSIKVGIEEITTVGNLIDTNIHLLNSTMGALQQFACSNYTSIKQTFNIHSYIDIALGNLLKSLKIDSLEFKNISDKSIHISSYPGVFLFIMTNLITNSVYYKDKSQPFRKIILDGYLENNSFIFTYTDSGLSIPEDKFNTLFDPILDLDIFGKSAGFGFGLHIIHNIITLKLKGTIICRSYEGHGSEFIITIPLDT